MDDYSVYAGERLVKLASQEFCENQGLPIVMKLWIRNCPELIADQQNALASLAKRFTKRVNLGIGSIYITDVGGQQLLPSLQLPNYQVITLAVVGQFLTLSTREDSGTQK